MRTIFVGLLLTIGSNCLADDREDLVGTWKITVYQDDGRDRLSRLGVGPTKKDKKPHVAKLVFTKDECYILRGDGRREMASGLANAGFKSCMLNPSTSPKSIDIDGFAGKNNEKWKTYMGIYKIDGDKLVICYCEQGKTRPTKFESDGANNLFEAQRISKDPQPIPVNQN